MRNKKPPRKKTGNGKASKVQESVKTTKPVQALRVEVTCPNDGSILQVLQVIGDSGPGKPPPRFRHGCKQCDHTEVLDQQYPIVKFENIEAAAQLDGDGKVVWPPVLETKGG